MKIEIIWLLVLILTTLFFGIWDFKYENKVQKYSEDYNIFALIRDSILTGFFIGFPITIFVIIISLLFISFK